MGLLLLDIRDKIAVIASDQAATDLEDNGKPNPLKIVSSKKVYVVDSFKGVIGFFGSEFVGKQRTHEWIVAFIAKHPDLNTIDDFAKTLGHEVTQDMGKPLLRLGFFIVGYAEQGPQFWYVWNYTQLNGDGSYGSTENTFNVRNELEAYIKSCLDIVSNEEIVRRKTTFQFRNGTLFPFIGVIKKLEDIINELPSQDRWFPVLQSVQQLAAYTLFKMEFIKRLYSKLDYQRQYPIDGAVSTYALNESGIWQKHKNGFKQILVFS
jgi:hypothetical protein